jgi:hypothetical protein
MMGLFVVLVTLTTYGLALAQSTRKSTTASANTYQQEITEMFS